MRAPSRALPRRRALGFFAQYNQLRGKVFKPLGRGGPDRARALLEQGMAAFRKEAKQ